MSSDSGIILQGHWTVGGIIGCGAEQVYSNCMGTVINVCSIEVNWGHQSNDMLVGMSKRPTIGGPEFVHSCMWM